MLGKLIKNEFVQRGKTIGLIFIAILVSSGAVALLWAIHESMSDPSDYFNFVVGLVTALFVLGMVVAGAGILVITINDFGKRLFKDQGYLTHTLPVKTSQIMLARMVFDVVVVIGTCIVYPLAICVAVRDFGFFGQIEELLSELLEMFSYNTVQASVVVLDIILVLIGMLISALASIWMFNASYAIGHSFGSNKKLMSVLAYIVIGTVTQLVGYITGYILSQAGAFEVVINDTSSVTHPEVSVFGMLLFVDIGTALLVAVYAFIAGFICKKKLNLE